ncbi:unnamed protein product [Auanema sp. JU1783]|nr:unnamed protein product [Auanema sp. JU1783]
MVVSGRFIVFILIAMLGIANTLPDNPLSRYIKTSKEMCSFNGKLNQLLRPENYASDNLLYLITFFFMMISISSLLRLFLTYYYVIPKAQAEAANEAKKKKPFPNEPQHEVYRGDSNKIAGAVQKGQLVYRIARH